MSRFGVSVLINVLIEIDHHPNCDWDSCTGTRPRMCNSCKAHEALAQYRNEPAASTSAFPVYKCLFDPVCPADRTSEPGENA